MATPLLPSFVSLSFSGKNRICNENLFTYYSVIKAAKRIVDKSLCFGQPGSSKKRISEKGPYVCFEAKMSKIIFEKSDLGKSFHASFHNQMYE